MNKSPKKAKIPPIINIFNRPLNSINLISMPNTTVANNPTIRPSNVFFGLIFFTINLLPIFEPITYAKVSKIAVLNMINPNKT